MEEQAAQNGAQPANTNLTRRRLATWVCHQRAHQRLKRIVYLQRTLFVDIGQQHSRGIVG